MAALPYMQLYVADYLADTQHLTTEEHGAYILLIFSYWQTGKPLRKDRLATVARLSNERWTDVERTLIEFFHDDGTHWQHFRIEADLEAVNSKASKASDAGKASAKARALKKQQESNAKQTNVATNVDETLQRNGNHTDTDTDTDTEYMVTGVTDFDSFWQLYPRKVSKADALKSWNKINPDKQLLGMISAGLTKYLASEAWACEAGKFIKHPATWLNHGCWNDDPKPASNVVKLNRHTGFDQADYNDGLDAREDGTNGF
jgi:uncharacterized protein YdaU (DUF1376 family)